MAPIASAMTAGRAVAIVVGAVAISGPVLRSG
jgi:hypothetical protein